jgi:hypothetical protein
MNTIFNGVSSLHQDDERILQAVEHYFPNYPFMYREVEGFGILRYDRHDNNLPFEFDGLVPWIGF